MRNFNVPALEGLPDAFRALSASVILYSPATHRKLNVGPSTWQVAEGVPWDAFTYRLLIIACLTNPQGLPAAKALVRLMLSQSPFAEPHSHTKDSGGQSRTVRLFLTMSFTEVCPLQVLRGEGRTIHSRSELHDSLMEHPVRLCVMAVDPRWSRLILDIKLCMSSTLS